MQMITMRALRHASLVFLVFVIACGQAPPPVGDPSPPAPTPAPDRDAEARIAFVSERSFVFSQRGDTAQLEAVVYDLDGRVDPSARVTWRSSDPAIVTVTSDGLVEAQVDFGSATILASYGSLQAEAATVLIAEVRPGTHVIPSDEVIAIDADETSVALRRTEATASIEAGDVVMSGDRAGLLVRVLDVMHEGDTVRMTTEPASLVDAFWRMQADLVGPSVRVELEVVEETADVLVLRATNGTGGGTVHTNALPAFECKRASVQLDVPIRLAKLRLDWEIVPRIVKVIEPYPDGSDSRVTRFETFLDIRGDGEVGWGDLRLGVRGKIECKVQVASIGPVGNFVGPLFLGIKIPTFVGVEFELEFEGVDVRFFLPEKRLTYDRQVGFRWTEADGLEGIWATGPEEATSTSSARGDDASPFTARVKAKAEPFIELRPQLFGGLIGGFGIDIEWLRVKGLAGLRFDVEPPFFRDAYGYVGPELELYLGAKADLKPLLDQLAVFDRIGSRLGLPSLQPYVNLEIILVDGRTTLGVSPVPLLVASTDRVDEGTPTVTFTLNVPFSLAGSLLSLFGDAFEVTLFGFRDGDREHAIPIGTGPVSLPDGNANVNWTPNEDERGVYEVFGVASAPGALLWAFGTPDPATVGVHVERYRVRLEPASAEFPDLPVNTTRSESFTLVNDGDPLDFEIVNAGDPSITLVGPTRGTLGRGEEVAVTYEFSCDGVLETSDWFEIAFFVDGESITADDLPDAFEVSYACVEPRVRLEPPSASYTGVVVPSVLAGVFTLVNEGVELQYDILNDFPGELTLVSPSSGTLPADDRVDVHYRIPCDEEKVGAAAFGLAFRWDGSIVAGAVPTTFSIDYECVARPDCPDCDDPDGDPDGAGEATDAGGRTGRSWGDPHLVTLDGRAYDFHAVGDYVLSKATTPGDDFEVQVRYRALRAGEPWFHPNAGISVGVAVAANVRGQIVNVFVTDEGELEVYLNGEQVSAAGDFAAELANGGSVLVDGVRATVSWPDSTAVTLDARTAKQRRFDYLDDVRVYVPTRRFGAVEGLLGDADGDPSNDIRVRGGEVIELPTPAWLYGTFRESWRVPLGSAASLFAKGPELYDEDFPGAAVLTLRDFTDAQQSAARAVCEAAGVVSHAVMQACMLDVLITRDDAVAEAAFLADPGAPKVVVTPALTYVYVGTQRYFGAVVTGASNPQVAWTATGGAVDVIDDIYMRYTAPTEAGEHTLRARLASDDRVESTARVVVLPLSCVPHEGFDRTWQGGVSRDWSEPANWWPEGEPGADDDAFVCAAAPNQPVLDQHGLVGSLTVETGATLELASFVLAVHRDLVADGTIEPQDGTLVIQGHGATLSGTLPGLLVNAHTRLAGPVIIEGTLTIGAPFRALIGHVFGQFASLTVAGQTLSVDGDLQTRHAACLSMRDDDDRVLVRGDATFNGTTNSHGECEMSTGLLEVTGTFSTPSGVRFSHYTPTGTHRLRLMGSSQQAIGFGGVAPGHAQGNRFQFLEIANQAGVSVSGDIDVRGEVRWTNEAGPVSGSRIATLSGAIDDAGGDRWLVDTTVVYGQAREVVLPAQLIGLLVVTTDVTLSAPLTIDGDVILATQDFTYFVRNPGALDPSGHALTITGNLLATPHGCLHMTDPADSVVILGDATFNNGSRVCNLSAGTLELAGDFSTAGGANTNHFTPTGTHRVRLNGNAAQTVRFGGVAPTSSNGNRFRFLEVANPAGVTVSADADVRADLDIDGRLDVPADTTVTIGGALVVRSGSVLDNDGTITPASCTVEEGATINGVDPCP